jgi:hypothetical protein
MYVGVSCKCTSITSVNKKVIGIRFLFSKSYAKLIDKKAKGNIALLLLLVYKFCYLHTNYMIR